MKGTKLLKRIGACVMAGASFTLVACDELTSSGSSNGGGSLNKDDVTLEAICELLEGYGVAEDMEDMEALFDEESAKGYEYLIVEEKGVILGNGDEEKTYGELGDCEHKKFNAEKTQVEAECESMGVKSSACKNCTAVKYVFEMPLGHEWDLIKEEPATETERGKKVYECKECREGKTERTPKLESDEGEDDSTGGNENVDASKVSIKIIVQDGPMGRAWLDEACKRFEELSADVSYAPGIKGVDFWVDCEMNIGANTMSTSFYQMFFCQDVNVRELAQGGDLLDISDVVVDPLTEYGETVSIEDKMQEALHATCQGPDGKYYALPDYEYYGGLTYDVDLFEEKNLFFAREGEAGSTYTDKFGTATFVEDENTERSCGPDGEYGTQDDGLPSSIQELLIFSTL